VKALVGFISEMERLGLTELASCAIPALELGCIEMRASACFTSFLGGGNSLLTAVCQGGSMEEITQSH
jgi:hypothetical protein